MNPRLKSRRTRLTGCADRQVVHSQIQRRRLSQRAAEANRVVRQGQSVLKTIQIRRIAPCRYAAHDAKDLTARAGSRRVGQSRCVPDEDVSQWQRHRRKLRERRIVGERRIV